MEPAAESLGTIEPLMTEGRKCAPLNVSMNCGEDVTKGTVLTLRASDLTPNGINKSSNKVPPGKVDCRFILLLILKPRVRIRPAEVEWRKSVKRQSLPLFVISGTFFALSIVTRDVCRMWVVETGTCVLQTSSRAGSHQHPEVGGLVFWSIHRSRLAALLEDLAR